jgi:hypothetical protein
VKSVQHRNRQAGRVTYFVTPAVNFFTERAKPLAAEMAPGVTMVKNEFRLWQMLLIFCAGSAVTVGCGKSELNYAPVNGSLTVDGNPIGRAQVTFSCEDVNIRPLPTTRGVTDNTGQFVLRSLTPEKRLIEGAVVGKHHVIITTQVIELDSNGGARMVRKEMLGDQYTKGKELTVDVPREGIQSLRFDLKSERPAGGGPRNAGG